LMDLMSNLGVKNIDCRQDGSKLGGARQSYLFNSTIDGIEAADAVLIIGSNPRLEAPLVNTRLRKAWIAGGMDVGLIGEAADLTYEYEHIGTSAADIDAFSKSTKGFAKKFKAAKKPAIIIGTQVYAAKILRAAGVLAKKVNAVREDWNGFNILHTAASRVGGLDMGFIPAEGGLSTDEILEAAQQGAVKTVYLLSADELDTSTLENTFVIYQGSHGDAGAHVADIILPGAAYTEKDGLYVNLEGRVQMGTRAVSPKGEAKDDWAIIRALSGHLNRELPYDSLGQLREKLFADHPTFAGLGYAPGSEGAADFKVEAIGEAGVLSSKAITNNAVDFYMTNPIARASNVMAECSALKGDIVKAAAE